MNLSWWLERAFWEYPDKEVVVDADGTSCTYKELRAQANRIGNVLRDHASLREDDVVVTVMPDCAEHVAILYAVLGEGAVFSGLNRRQKHEKFISDVERSRPAVAIVVPECMGIADLLAGQGIKVYLTHGQHPIYPDLKKLCKTASSERRLVSRSNSDIAAVNFTAGTSGASKGVIFTHGTLGTSAQGAIFLGGVDSKSRNLSLVGMFHSGGIHDSIRMVMAGGTILWSDGWDVDRVVGIFQSHQPNWMYWIVPTMMRDLMRHPEWASLRLEGLKTHVAGEVVPPDVEAALREKGAIVGSVYGLTEAMPVCVTSSSIYYRDEAVVPKGSSGRPNKHFCEVQLQDPFTGEELIGGDVEGEVCIRGDVITPGYYNDPAKTADAFDTKGFLHTSDFAYRDADGWFYLRGRTDDIIKSGAEKLSLLEIDTVLQSHPKVIDAGCIGVAHERFGEAVAAFIVLSETIPDEEARAMLDAWCIEKIERWKRPRLYCFTDQVPRTMAKRSKMQGEMRRQLEGVMVRDADGVITLSELKQRAG